MFGISTMPLPGGNVAAKISKRQIVVLKALNNLRVSVQLEPKLRIRCGVLAFCRLSCPRRHNDSFKVAVDLGRLTLDDIRPVLDWRWVLQQIDLSEIRADRRPSIPRFPVRAGPA
jgi:hypothetical protein